MWAIRRPKDFKIGQHTAEGAHRSKFLPSVVHPVVEIPSWLGRGELPTVFFLSIPNANSRLQCLYSQKLAFLSCMSHEIKYRAILWEMAQYLEMEWSNFIWLTYQIYHSYWRLQLFTNVCLPTSKSKKLWFSWLTLTLNTRQKKENFSTDRWLWSRKVGSHQKIILPLMVLL